MRVLHVASFQGNVGDNANHAGMRRLLQDAMGDIEFENLEMRRFYQKYDGADKLRFDDAFADRANTFDLVIFGGGNFFEVWIEASSTGCTIDLPPEVIDRLQTKVVFFGLGFDRYKGSSEVTLARFLGFMERLADRDRFLVTVRNDGSWEQFVSAYGEDRARTLIRKVPDGGFFLEAPGATPTIDVSKYNIVLSLAMDMAEVRYGADQALSGKANLIRNLAEFMTVFHRRHPDTVFTLMPHIYSDLQIISECLEALPDFLRRSAVRVGACVSGEGTEALTFVNYAQADCVIGMRFHPNVCSVGFGVPVIGLGTYGKIPDLFRELGLSDYCVDARSGRFSEDLLTLALAARTDSAGYRQRLAAVKRELDGQAAAFFADVRAFLRS